MNNEEIIILSSILSIIVIVILKRIKEYIDKIGQDIAIKRFNELERLKKDGKVLFESINLDKQMNRFEMNDNREMIIDGKKYTDKEYYFFIEEGKGYIFGKKENRVIILIGKFENIS